VGLYVTTGILGSLIDFLIFTIALWSGVSTLLAQWSGASVGAIHNSLIHHYFVFDHSKKLRHTVLPNTILSVFVILISGPALIILNKMIGDIWISKVLILSLTAVLSYLVRKLVIFNK
jgi:putative flippase GtrA